MIRSLSSKSSSPPLNCYPAVNNDDFSGWYAVSDKNKCNDFCFWKQPDSYYEKNDESNDNDENNNNDEEHHPTADPHQTTITKSNAKWVCILNSAGDETNWDNMESVSTIQVFYDENIHQFDPLRCSRGAGEQINSYFQLLMSSVGFWSFVMVFIFVFYIAQIVYVTLWKRQKKQYDVVCGDDDIGDIDDIDDIDKDTQRNDDNNTKTILRKVKTCCSKKRFLLVLLIVLDLFLMYVLFTAILVIVEVDQKIDLPSNLKSLTPSCSNTELLCPIADVPIDNPSKSRNSTSSDNENYQDSNSNSNSNSNTFPPFSYIIASDVQLDWYDGESAYIGLLDYPPPCSSTDSCDSCNRKISTYTNNQMKKSIEKLLNKENDNTNSNNSGTTNSEEKRPIPKTLIMNGDLTSYFHRTERERYESYYHNLNGLEQYFPGLGNHDYAQYSGATYNNDEWVGPHRCNGKHAISYFKGAFCNQIPKFDAKERLTRYDPKSLSYSWEEGSYHFVQVHFHPTFENAGLNISSSLQWLERDLRLANENNLISVLYVHAANLLPDILGDILIENNVAVIFSGHLHRCLGRKCELVRGLNSHDGEEHNRNETALTNMLQNTRGEFPDDDDRIEKCFPSSALLCGRNAKGNGYFYVNDMDSSLSVPKRKLESKVPIQRGLCPVQKYGPYINEIENTSLCRRLSVPTNFPFYSNKNDNGNNYKTIPIFWSGSASFESFLSAEFYNDRIVVNMMTAAEGKEGERYIDVNTVPNAVYPFHNIEDLDEHTIFV